MVRSQFVAGVTDTAVRAVHVEALAAGTSTGDTTLVSVHAERTVCGHRESGLTHAAVRAGRVLAASIQADSRVLVTLVHVCRQSKIKPSALTFMQHITK